MLGFNVRPDRSAAEIAEQANVTIQTYTIIYELIDGVEKAMAGKTDLKQVLAVCSR